MAAPDFDDEYYFVKNSDLFVKDKVRPPADSFTDFTFDFTRFLSDKHVATLLSQPDVEDLR